MYNSKITYFIENRDEFAKYIAQLIKTHGKKFDIDRFETIYKEEFLNIKYKDDVKEFLTTIGD